MVAQEGSRLFFSGAQIGGVAAGAYAQLLDAFGMLNGEGAVSLSPEGDQVDGLPGGQHLAPELGQVVAGSVAAVAADRAGHALS